jgi:hypothetical protein
LCGWKPLDVIGVSAQDVEGFAAIMIARRTREKALHPSYVKSEFFADPRAVINTSRRVPW